jgi:hypothetical protein
MRRLILMLMLLMPAMACAGAQPAASTTQPVIRVRDCATGVETAVLGQTLYLSQLPAKWTLSYDFGLAEGHTAKVVFKMDQQAATACYQPPYCPGNRQPLTLAVGRHTIEVVVNGATIPATTFNLANAPPPPPVTPPAAQFGVALYGENLVGADYASGDFTLHPQLPVMGHAIGLTFWRTWEEEPQLLKSGDGYWALNRKIKAAGFKTALQVQLPGKQPWADDGAANARRIVAGKAVDAVLLGNEFNTVRNLADPGTYFLGGDAAATRYCATVGPIYSAGGIVAVAPSRINDFAGIVSRYDAGQYAGLKNLDLHLYSDDENWLAKQFRQFDAFCGANDIQGWVSEWNLRMKKGETLAQWSARLAVAINAIRSTSLVVIHFSAIPTGHPSDDVTAMLDQNYQPLGVTHWPLLNETH